MSTNATTPSIDMLDLLLAFSTIPAIFADAWVDNRLLGLTMREIGEQEGVSRAGIEQRIRKADRAIRAHVERRERRRLL